MHAGTLPVCLLWRGGTEGGGRPIPSNVRRMVADDVIAGFTRLLDPKTAAPSRSNYAMIAGMSAPDPYKVRFDLSYPYSGFADIFTDRQVKIVPRDLVDQLSTKPIGTGPFMFQSYTPGDRLVLVKNPNYFERGCQSSTAWNCASSPR